VVLILLSVGESKRLKKISKRIHQDREARLGVKTRRVFAFNETNIKGRKGEGRGWRFLFETPDRPSRGGPRLKVMERKCPIRKKGRIRERRSRGKKSVERLCSLKETTRSSCKGRIEETHRGTQEAGG